MRQISIAATVLAVSLTLTAVSVQAAEAGKYQAVVYGDKIVLLEVSTGRTWRQSVCFPPQEQRTKGAAEPCWVPVLFKGNPDPLRIMGKKGRRVYLTAFPPRSLIRRKGETVIDYLKRITPK